MNTSKSNKLFDVVDAYANSDLVFLTNGTIEQAIQMMEDHEFQAVILDANTKNAITHEDLEAMGFDLREMGWML